MFYIIKEIRAHMCIILLQSEQIEKYFLICQ